LLVLIEETWIKGFDKASKWPCTRWQLGHMITIPYFLVLWSIGSDAVKVSRQ